MENVAYQIPQNRENRWIMSLSNTTLMYFCVIIISVALKRLNIVPPPTHTPTEKKKKEEVENGLVFFLIKQVNMKNKL